MKYALIAFCAGLLSLVLTAGCGAFSDDGGSSDAVAIVNGEEIARSDFEKQLEQTKVFYQQQGLPEPQGQDLEMLSRQVVDQMVQQRLVIQEAESRGIEASNEEVNAQFQQTVGSFPDEEAFNQALEQEGLSEPELEDRIEENIKIEKLLNSVVEEEGVTPPTEEELRQAYDQVSQQQELPPFEDVRPQLESLLLGEKRNEVTQNFIRDLEAKSSIEVLL